MLKYRISFYILYFNQIYFFLPTNIPRILLNNDLLIFVPGPGLQLLLVSIMKSAKNVIKNYFFNNFFSILQYVIYFYKIYPSFRKRSFINNYLITNYWFWAQCFWPGLGPCMIATFISNGYEYDELTQFFPRFNFYSPLSRSKTPTYPCIIFYFWLTKVLTSDGSQIRLTCIRNIC